MESRLSFCSLHHYNVESIVKGYIPGRANLYVVTFPLSKMNQSVFRNEKNKLYFTALDKSSVSFKAFVTLNLYSLSKYFLFSNLN